MGFKWLQKLTDAFSPVAKDETAIVPPVDAAPAPQPVTSTAAPAPIAAQPPPSSPLPVPSHDENFEEDRETFFAALKTDDAETVERIAAQYPGECLNWRVKEGSPLKVAQDSGSLKAFMAVVEHGANPEENYGSGKTPLHLAIENGRDDFVDYLLDKNVNLESQFADTEYSLSSFTDYVHTPLGLAILHGRKNAFVKLIERGAATTSPYMSKYEFSSQFTPDDATAYATQKEQYLMADLAKRADKIRAAYVAKQSAPPPEPVVEAEQSVTLMPQLRLTGTGQKP